MNRQPGKSSNMESRKKLNNEHGKKKRSSQSSTGNSFGKKAGVALLFLIFLMSLAVLVAGLLFYFKYGKELIQYQKEAKQLVSASSLDTFRQMETSLVYDSKDQLISVVKGEKDVYYLTGDKIPDYAKMAMISIEDKKFPTHEGVDGEAILRAAVALIKNDGKVTQGASTITQQLARNIFLSNEVTWERKLKEMFIAIELEKKYDKEQIMEFYLNNIYFANGYYGIEAASQGYFSVSSNDLTLSQIAFLCAIPNNPTLYNPMTGKDNTIGRRDRILTQMYEDGMIGEEEYRKAKKEEIEIVQKKSAKNNYIDTYVFYNATRALMAEQGFEFRNTFDNEADRIEYEEEYNELYNQFQKSLFYEGYRIYTSIDMDKQKLLQKTIDETLEGYTEVSKEGIYTLQSGAVTIDNSTGRVVAMVGGRFQESAGYTLNRGYQSYRQPGSAIKPLIVYTPVFERGYNPENTVKDEPIKDGPKNAGGGYSGNITLRRAIELSKNTIAWQLYKELTPQVGISYLLHMNFSKIDEKDNGLAASLGGFTNGTSPLEMTAAYGTIENDGMYREPTCIVKILDSQGNIIVGEETSQKRIYDANAARMMTDVLTGVLKNGTGKGLGLKNMSSAGKTGTTNDNKDGWFVGYTPYYTTGVWVGYDTPKTLGNLYGSTLPGTIWNSYMNEIHQGLKNKSFPAYEVSPVRKENTDQQNTESNQENGTTGDTPSTQNNIPPGDVQLNEENQNNAGPNGETKDSNNNNPDAPSVDGDGTWTEDEGGNAHNTDTGNDTATDPDTDNSTNETDPWTAPENETGTGDGLWSDDNTW